LANKVEFTKDRKSWNGHIDRMDEDRWPEVAGNYTRIGQGGGGERERERARPRGNSGTKVISV
jgi:hypothetical protein